MPPKAPSAAPSRVPLVLGLVVFVGVVVLAVRARDEARDSPRFHVDPAAVAVTARPEWMPETLAAGLAAHLGERLGDPVTLVEPGPLRAWEAQLAEEGWVRDVTTLEPLFPGRARARLRLRRPVLVLPTGHLAADDGRVLGRGEVRLEPAPLRLTGPSAPADVAACAAAAAELLPFRTRLDDFGLRVEEVESWGAGRVVFRELGRGVILDWGRPRGVDAWSEVDLPPATKLRNLERAMERMPGLVGVARVELWRAEPVIHPAGG